MVPLDCPCARGCVGTASRVPAANLRQFVTRIASEACTRWKDTFLLAVRAGRHILRPRAMQVINCAAWYGQQRRQAVARRDSMAAYPANARNSLEKQVKNRPKKKKKPEKIGACGGPLLSISARSVAPFSEFHPKAEAFVVNRSRGLEVGYPSAALGTIGRTSCRQ